MRRASNSHQIALRIAVGYMIAASLWVLTSDRVVAMFSPSMEAALQSVKGLLFVLFTGIGLYVVIERVAQRFTTEAVSARAVERMLSHVVESVPVGVVLTSDDNTVTFANKRAEELLGVETAEIAGGPLDKELERMSPDAVAILGEAMRTGEPGVVALSAPDEDDRSVVIHAASLDSETNASGWIISMAEISGHLHGALEIEQIVSGYQLVAAVAESAGTATEEIALLRKVCELAVESGRYVSAWSVWSEGTAGRIIEAGSAGLGVRSAEIARLMTASGLPGMLSVAGREGDVPVLTVSNDIGGDPSNVWYPAAVEDQVGSSATLRVIAGDGSFGIVTLFATEPGAFDADELEMLERMSESVSFVFDRLALERRRFSAEQELHTSEQGYRALFQNHPAPMWVYDLETLRFLAVNDAAVAKYGYTPEQFLAMTIADIRPKSDIAALAQNVSSVTEGFEDAGIWAHIDSAGREFPVHVYSHTIEWQGHHSELVMSLEVARLDF